MDRRLAAMMLGAALGLMAIGLALGIARVLRLERSELAHEGQAQNLNAWKDAAGHSPVSARLAEVELRAGDQAVFEVCTDDGMDPNIWSGTIGFAVFQRAPMRLMLRVMLDHRYLATVRRGHSGACLQLGSGPIEDSGRYSVDAIWPDQPPPERVMGVPIRARVLARPPIERLERTLVAGLALATVLLIGLGWTRGRRTSTGLPRNVPIDYGWLVGATLAVLAAAQLPLWGSTLGLAKGLLLASLQLALALGWSRRAGPDRLATHRPDRPLLHLTAALIACPLLVASARLALSIVPSTGEAPIETFISWPSGKLAFALLGVVLPLAEELFFRGFVYGALIPLGARLAFPLTVVLFAALHAQQAWGNWGALSAILSTGVVLTALRVWTGSVLPGALAHTLYNVVLSLRSL